jgi:DNA-binding transcriptional MerR regulator
MTVGQLARRTGLSVRLVREYERLGLIYSAGRSEANYRLFDEVALACAGAVEQLRSLGLTLAELRQLALLHRAGDEERLEEHLQALLERSQTRIEDKIAELSATRERIRAFRANRAAAVTAVEMSAEVRLDSHLERSR